MAFFSACALLTRPRPSSMRYSLNVRNLSALSAIALGVLASKRKTTGTNWQNCLFLFVRLGQYSRTLLLLFLLFEGRHFKCNPCYDLAMVFFHPSPSAFQIPFRCLYNLALISPFCFSDSQKISTDTECQNSSTREKLIRTRHEKRERENSHAPFLFNSSATDMTRSISNDNFSSGVNKANLLNICLSFSHYRICKAFGSYRALFALLCSTV